jgi:hypothetical protein
MVNPGHDISASQRKLIELKGNSGRIQRALGNLIKRRECLSSRTMYFAALVSYLEIFSVYH